MAPKNHKPKYPGIRITTNGNTLVSYFTEARLAEAGVFYPITPSTEMGEVFHQSYAQGELNVFGDVKIAIETESEHSAQGGAIAASVTGKRVVNFTSGQGVLFGLEPYYHAPGKLSTMVLNISARALTKSALNVHCGHDDVYATMDTGWTILFAKDAQQASDQAMILRKVNELALTPGINVQDGFLTSHLERSFLRPEADLIREFLGRPDDIIECPTDAQRELFGPKRRRIPAGMDLRNPILMGPVQNQEHYMAGVIARRDNFVEHILGFLETAYDDFAELTGRHYGLVSQYNCEDADTVFVALGSGAENCEAGVDYIQEKHGEKVGVVHINVIRPFPEKAIVEALRGKKRVIVLERADDQMAPENPMTRDIRSSLSKALSNSTEQAYDYLPSITADEMPRIFSGSYGMGSRDFRPEGILGAWEFCTGRTARQDGKTIKDGVSYFYVGVNHACSVISEDRPSLLPDKSIAIRFHSLGGWGAITTGKNLGEIMGELSTYIAKRDGLKDEDGADKEVYHISANPKYGSEKKGAPTNYFLVAAPERIRVNCDLKHVDVVLCCDPKAFTHANPIEGMNDGGALIIETNETTSEGLWSRIPPKYRPEMISKKIRLYGLAGFDIAIRATERLDLQYRMQGNSLLGAFFKVSPFLPDNNIPDGEFLETVEAQYNKKFGKFGESVVTSNMQVMKEGFQNIWQADHGAIDAPDRSALRAAVTLPVSGATRFGDPKVEQPEKSPLFTLGKYDSEFRADFGYHTPASPLASTGAMAAATAATNSKYVARRRVPIFYPENCTQCMSCISSCPDTAMPNTAQDIDTVLKTAIRNYVGNQEVKATLVDMVPELEEAMRTKMFADTQDKEAKTGSLTDYLKQELEPKVAGNENLAKAAGEIYSILEQTPMAFAKAKSIFGNPEKKNKGAGGLFSIMINDICKGCGECVTECGEHQALKMEEETEEVNALHITQIKFLDLLPETPQKFLGKFNADDPMEAKAAVLQNHLMVRKNYEAMVSGDGSCAGCGEKSVLKSVSSLTEAYMRPLYHQKADRMDAKAAALKSEGAAKLAEMKSKDEESYKWWATTIKHAILNLGGESDEDSYDRIEKNFKGSDQDLIDALVLVLGQDAFNHRDLRAVDGRYDNGMSVMMMSSSTGCNSVYGSTHPNNPHSYPWMNSLFQDSPTLAWLFGESIMADHAKRSVIPERLADALLEGKSVGYSQYFDYTHFADALMTDLEIKELPKVWAVGGDGGMGDIGFQWLSKVVLQNRPNVKLLMLDTQVYSNTGGQNSDSSVMPGGFDMNQHGKATEGKLTERKEVAAIFMAGHGSPYVAQVSMANSATMFKAILDGLDYRGTMYLQAFTSCQPEHGISDDVSTTQAKYVRDSRGVPQFIFDPNQGETYIETLSLKGNPDLKRDWMQKTIPGTKDKYNYTVAHWATTENRFRKHFFKVKPGEETNLIHVDEMLTRITQSDITYRKHIHPENDCFVPAKGVYIMVEKGDKMVPMGISRQMVLFCVERRKNWRMLQNWAGLPNSDYAKD